MTDKQNITAELTTRVALNSQQEDAFLMEKALEVGKISASFQIESRLKEIKKDEISEITNLDAAKSKLHNMIKERALALLQKDKNLIKLFEALSAVTGRSLCIKNMVTPYPNYLGKAIDSIIKDIPPRIEVWFSSNLRGLYPWDAEIDEEETAYSDHKGAIDTSPRVEESDFCVCVTMDKELSAQAREFIKTRDLVGRLKAEREDIVNRKEKIGEQMTNLRGKILRSQLEQTQRGSDMMKMMDKAVNASVNSNYISLLD